MSDFKELDQLLAKNVRKQIGKYGFATNAEEIEPEVDLHGKNVIVTGAYGNGIGFETARVFASRGARVILAARDVTRGLKAAEDIKASTKNQNIEFIELNLDSFAAVREFAKKFNALNIPLHYLINNAGVMACPLTRTKDGLETQVGVNHFGHFLLTNLLIPKLLEGAPSRVVVVASSGHVFSSIHWDDVNFEKTPYDEMEAYGQSKTANILFAVELNNRYKSKGVIANSLHPGYIKTDLQRHMTAELAGKVMKGAWMEEAMKYSCAPKTVQQGAATTIYAALSPDAAEGGKFYDDCHEAVDPPAKAYALDAANAKKLWAISEKVVGLSH